MGKQRPGVMIYFDIAHSINRLSNEERGILFSAIMEYGEFGTVPALDGMLAMAWDFIRPRLDRDAKKYEETCQKRTAAINSRWNKERAVNTIDENSTNTNEYSSIENIPTEQEPETKTERYLYPQKEIDTQPQLPTATRGVGSVHSKTTEQEFNDMRTAKMRSLMNWS